MKMLMYALSSAGLVAAILLPVAADPVSPPVPGQSPADASRQVTQWTRQLADPGPGQIQDDAVTQLDRLQQRMQQAWTALESVEAQVECSQVRMQACYALADHARRQNQMREMAMRISQVRSEAWRLRQLRDPAARITGEFWLLQTDLANSNRLSSDLNTSQKEAVVRLEQFIAAMQELGGPIEPRGRRILLDTCLALLRLYDQRGMSAQARRLVEQLRQGDLPPEVRSYLDESFGHLEMIGRPVQLSLALVDGRTWNLADHRGKVVVIYFWPGPAVVESVGDGLDGILGRNGVSVLLVDLSRAEHTGLQLPSMPWPVYRQEKGFPQLTQQFFVRSLPRFVVFDRSGVVAAIGGPAIGDQIEAVMQSERARGPATSPPTPRVEER